MNKFEKQLEKWNHGILRGAQAKLARILQVSTATVALWSTGQRHPSKGYIAKMAQLFGLDTYEATRLFAASALYPLPASRSRLALLKENTSLDTYSTYMTKSSKTTSNTLSLPVFAQLPPSFPAYQEQDIIDWWILPRHATKGSQFIVQRTDTNGNELFFIKPAKTWINKALFLAKNAEKQYIFGRVQMRGKQVFFQELSGKKAVRKGNDLQPIGQIILKLTDEL